MTASFCRRSRASLCFGVWEDDPETSGSPEDHCAASQVAMRIKWAKSGARQCPEQSLVQSECPDVCDYGSI